MDHHRRAGTWGSMRGLCGANLTTENQYNVSHWQSPPWHCSRGFPGLSLKFCFWKNIRIAFLHKKVVVKQISQRNLILPSLLASALDFAAIYVACHSAPAVNPVLTAAHLAFLAESQSRCHALNIHFLPLSSCSGICVHGFFLVGLLSSHVFDLLACSIAVYATSCCTGTESASWLLTCLVGYHFLPDVRNLLPWTENKFIV